MTRAKGPNYNSPHNLAVQRLHLRKKLAWDWIATQRPDVATAINAECIKRYPLKPDLRIRYHELPESLRDLK